MEVSDRVVVMSNGKIEQMGTPEQVWQHPSNAFVYDFLGNYNEFDGWKDKDGMVHLAETDLVEIPPSMAATQKPAGWLGRYPEISSLVSKVIPGFGAEQSLIPALPQTRRAVRKPTGGKAVKIYARPHEMWIAKTPDEQENIKARVIHLNPAGSLVKLELERSGGQILQVEIPKSVIDQFGIAKGDTLFVRPKQTKVFE